MAKQIQTKTAAELRADADALAKQASALRAEARKKARQEKRAAEVAEAERVRDEWAAMLGLAQQVKLTVNGEAITVHAYLLGEYERSRNADAEKA